MKPHTALKEQNIIVGGEAHGIKSSTGKPRQRAALALAVAHRAKYRGAFFIK